MKTIFLFCILLFGIQTFAASQSILISTETYRKLNKKNKKTYIATVRGAVFQLEQEAGNKFAVNESQKAHPFLTAFLEFAFAADTCSVGGNTVPKVNGLCSTRANPCKTETISDGFQCGSVFGGKCISRGDVSTLSYRCYKASQEAGIPTASDYASIKVATQKQYDESCGNSNSVGCRIFSRRIEELNKNAESTAAQGGSQTPLLTPAPTPTPAPNPAPIAPPTAASASPVPAAPALAAPAPAAAASGAPPVAAPPAASAPPAAAQPPAAAVDPECTKMMNFVIEGTSQVNNGELFREKMLHGEATHYLGQVANNFKSENFWFEPSATPLKKSCEPNRTPQGEMQGIMANDPQQVIALKKATEQGKCDQNYHNSIYSFMANGKLVKDTSGDFNYKFENANLRPQKFGETCAPQPGTAFFTSFNSGSGKLEDAFKKYLDRIDSLKNKCGANAKIGASVALYAHGHNNQSGSECSFQISPGTMMSAKDFYAKIYKPLRQKGIDTSFNLEPCYGNCLIDAIKALEAKDKDLAQVSGKSCLFATAPSGRPGYGQDELYDSVRSPIYNHFLGNLQNPLKANLCATAMDKWNQGGMHGVEKSYGTTRSAGGLSSSQKSPFDNPEVIASFQKIAKTLNDDSFNALAATCRGISRGSDFPKGDPKTTLTDLERHFSLQCLSNPKQFPEFSGAPQNLNPIMGLDGLLKAAVDQSESPGITAVKKFAESNNEVLKACSQDWSVYSREKTLNSQLEDAREQRGPARARPIPGAASGPSLHPRPDAQPGSR